MVKEINTVAKLGAMFGKSVAFFKSPPFNGEKFYDPTTPLEAMFSGAMGRAVDLAAPFVPGHKARQQAEADRLERRALIMTQYEPGYEGNPFVNTPGDLDHLHKDKGPPPLSSGSHHD